MSTCAIRSLLVAERGRLLFTCAQHGGLFTENAQPAADRCPFLPDETEDEFMARIKAEPLLILSEHEATECHEVAAMLRECVTVVLGGTRPALDRVGHLVRAAELLEKLYVAHYPPKKAAP